jgi:hypothetical protein
MLNIRPVLSVMPPVTKLEDELQRIIKNSPFLGAKLKLDCQKETETIVKTNKAKVKKKPI